MLYFAYGSNLNLGQIQNRCPDSVPVARVILKGYQLCFNRVADIVKKEGGVVHGARLSTLFPKQILRTWIFTKDTPNSTLKFR